MDTEPRRLRRAFSRAALGAVGGAVLIVQAGLLAGPAAAADTGRLASPEGLRPFFAALARLDTGQTRLPVRVMQIGDSHTANDAFSGRLRERFQARFGGAGRGWLPAGVPYKYFQPRLVSVSETGWKHPKPDDRVLTLGLDAVAARSQPPEAAMAIESTEAAGFDRFSIEYLARPNGPAFTLQIDEAAPIRVSTASAQTAVKHFDVPLRGPAHRAELRAATAGSPVDLLGWSVERRAPGVIYENHGTIGATIGLLGQIDPRVVGFELGERRPALIVVAFGTNEGFAEKLDPGRYAAQFHAAVAGLLHRAPGAAVLVLGPPDAERHAPSCSPVAACRPAADDDCTWREPANLADVRALQRRVARQQGWAYWDWFAAMGGACGIDRMTAADPPLAMPDHVHPSRAGYEALADALFGDLMGAYDMRRGPARRS